MNLAAYCQTSSIQQLFFLTLFEAWVARGVHLCFGNRCLGTTDLAIVAQAVELKKKFVTVKKPKTKSHLMRKNSI